MIELTSQYIISQILTVIIYIFICTTFFLKNRKDILRINVICDIIQIIAFIMLDGYTGAVMVLIIAIRDFYLLLNEKIKLIDDKKNSFVFLFTLIIIIAVSVPSYDGIFSLFSIIATIISTFAIWQKSPRIYKLLAIFSSISWLIYHFYLMSIMAMVLESILLISAIAGFIQDFMTDKKTQKNLIE